MYVCKIIARNVAHSTHIDHQRDRAACIHEPHGINAASAFWVMPAMLPLKLAAYSVLLLLLRPSAAELRKQWRHGSYAHAVLHARNNGTPRGSHSHSGEHSSTASSTSHPTESRPASSTPTSSRATSRSSHSTRPTTRHSSSPTSTEHGSSSTRPTSSTRSSVSTKPKTSSSPSANSSESPRSSQSSKATNSSTSKHPKSSIQHNNSLSTNSPSSSSSSSHSPTSAAAASNAKQASKQSSASKSRKHKLKSLSASRASASKATNTSASKTHASKVHASKESASEDHASKVHASKESASKDHASKDSVSKAHASKAHALKESASQAPASKSASDYSSKTAGSASTRQSSSSTTPKNTAQSYSLRRNIRLASKTTSRHPSSPSSHTSSHANETASSTSDTRLSTSSTTVSSKLATTSGVPNTSRTSTPGENSKVTAPQWSTLKSHSVNSTTGDPTRVLAHTMHHTAAIVSPSRAVHNTGRVDNNRTPNRGQRTTHRQHPWPVHQDYTFVQTDSLAMPPSSSSHTSTSTLKDTTSTKGKKGHSKTTNYPSSIVPSKADLTVPNDCFVFAVLFRDSLPWSWVAHQRNTTAQIFSYLPKVLAAALDIDSPAINTLRLERYTNKSSVMPRTLYVAYAPNSTAKALQTAVTQKSSPLYSSGFSGVSAELIHEIDSEYDPLWYMGRPKDDHKHESPNVSDQAIAGSVGGVGGAAALGILYFIFQQRVRRRRMIKEDQLLQRRCTIQSFSGLEPEQEDAYDPANRDENAPIVNASCSSLGLANVPHVSLGSTVHASDVPESPVSLRTLPSLRSIYPVIPVYPPPANETASSEPPAPVKKVLGKAL